MTHTATGVFQDKKHKRLYLVTRNNLENSWVGLREWSEKHGATGPEYTIDRTVFANGYSPATAEYIKSPDEEIKPGTVVVLKSGGMPMTVYAVGERYLSVVWHDHYGNKLRTADVPAVCVKVVPDVDKLYAADE